MPALAAGGSANREMGMDRVPAGGLAVSKSLFGHMPDGRQVDKYILSNVHHMEVGILLMGELSNL